MNRTKLNEAIFEAERFLRVAKIANKKLIESPYEHIDNTKESRACKRASLDLTRALAELRKPL